MASDDSPEPNRSAVPLPFPVTRRVVVAGVAAGAVAVLGSGPTAVAIPVGSDRARYLPRAEFATLEALVDRIVPGQPEDIAAGAVAARCHNAIDALLGAFRTDPPRIYAGGPFSTRGGSRVNHFARFVELDPYERLSWELRIRGSRGSARLERNGGVVGYQRLYRRGLRALAADVPGFASLPGPARDLALRGTQNRAVTAMMGLAVTNTLEFMYGAPEYGGNYREAGWKGIGFDGDRQPRGYTRAEVERPDTELLPILDVPLEDLLGDAFPDLPPVPATAATSAVTSALAVAGSEASLGYLARAGGDHRQLTDDLREMLAPLTDATSPLSASLTRIHQGADEIVRAVRRRDGGS